MLTRASAPRPRLDALTSLRMFAALAVFNFHMEPLFGHGTTAQVVGHLTWAGPTGVSFFFILSGFVLTWSRRNGSRTDFYRRRFARIYPLHLATWAAAGLLFLAIGTSISGRGAALSAVLLQSWDPTRDGHLAMDAPSWSLSCEAFFYALFPWLLTGLLRLGRDGRQLLAGGLLCATVVLAALGPIIDPAVGLGHDVWFAEFFPAARLPEFTLGMVLALEVETAGFPRVPVPAAATLAVAAFLGTSALSTARLRVVLTLVPYLLLIGAVARRESTGAPVRALRHRALVRLGEWSFAFYLVHGLVFVGAVELEGRHPLGPAAAFGWAGGILLASLVISAVAYAGIERPCERALRPGRDRWSVPDEPPAAPAGVPELVTAVVEGEPA